VADVDLDEDVDRAAGRGDGAGEPLDALNRIDRDRQPDAFGERGDARQLGSVDHLVRDVDVVDAGGGERFRLARLLDADADRAGLSLHPRDRRALVHLRVRPQPDAVAARERRHGGEVSLHRVEVDDERRRVDRLDRIADLRLRRGVAHHDSLQAL